MKKILGLACAAALMILLAAWTAPALGGWLDGRKASALTCGTVTAKGYDDGQARALPWPLRDLLQPGVYTDGQAHYLIEVTGEDASAWWEVSKEQMDGIRIGDTVCRRTLTE